MFDTVEELTQLWGYSEDLETYEHTCKEYLSIFAGPVRPPSTRPSHCVSDSSAWQHAHLDLLDEVRASLRPVHAWS